MTIEIVALHFGSAGSRQAGAMTLVRRSGESCETKAAAIKSVAKFFWKKWVDDNPPVKPKKCCVAKTKTDAEPFCKKCSRPLSEPLFDHEVYTDWLLQQPSQTVGDWDSHEGEWWPWNTLALISHHWRDGVGCMVVSESAETMLTWALDPEAKWIPDAYRSTIRDLQTQELNGTKSIDDLIEERTKTFDELIEQRLGVVG
jgi:hypothetical protein